MGDFKQAFFELSDFPTLKALASDWLVMRDELANLQAPVMDIDRNKKTHHQVRDEILQRTQAGEKYGWIKGWGRPQGNTDWVQYGLVIDDLAMPFASAALPKTVALLQGIKGLHVAALSRLAAGSFLMTHTHPELPVKGLLQMHVTLQAPDDRNFAYLNVAGEFRHHLNGSGYIFDGSLDHFAVNASYQDRIILYLEFSKKRLMRRE
ncbi:MAG: aspartyl/asparaginyl beta-hydroxylase domain-containing protein [Methylocella sp.]